MTITYGSMPGVYHSLMILRIPTPPDFDFLECINAHGWRQLAPFSWDSESNTLERIEKFEGSNIVLLKILGTSDAVEVDVAGDAKEEEVINRVRRMLQLDLAFDRFHAYCASLPVLQHIPVARQGRMLRSPTLFEDVLKVLATTNTTWTQTKGMVSRIVETYGGLLESDPSRRAFPTAEQIASVPMGEFAAKAKMGYRNAHAHKIATDIFEGTLDLEAWLDSAVPSADLYKRFLNLPGIGPYAASCLMIYSGRYDRVNVDSWARMMVGKELGRPVTDKEVHAFFEPYGEWKALVYHFYRWK